MFFLLLLLLFDLFFLSNLFIAFEAKLFTNPGTLFLAKGIATFVSVFCLNYLTKKQDINLIGLL